MDRGAHFYRCDFQVHSPRDWQWEGPRPKTDAERRDYADQLVLACRDKGLQAIGITDHHDMAFVESVRDAATRERINGKEVPADKRLAVFPGMELTLAIPCQAIVLFDANLTTSKFSLALHALGLEDHDPGDPKGPSVVRIEKFSLLSEVCKALDEFLEGQYIVLPNVGDENKQDSLLRRKMYMKYKEMPCVGGYVDGSVGKLSPGTVSIHAGEDASWGSKRIAVFQTSDSRSSDHQDLGKHSTWVKWAEPTAEALRQACLAQESRISHAPPETPSSAVTQISVGNSEFMGPVQLVVNPQYTAFIGGRGTGKSTVLEYLRWALCDQPPEIPEELGAEIPNYVARRRSLIEKTLKPQEAKGTVDVRFVANGLPHHVRRYATTGEVHLRIGDGELKECTEADVRALLPIQAFSQKQLSSVAVRIEELARFVEQPIRDKLAKRDAELEKLAEEMREVLTDVEKARVLERRVGRAELEVQSLSEQVKRIRDSFTDLTEGDQKTIAAKQGHDSATTIVDQWERDLRTGDRALAALEKALEGLPTVPDEGVDTLPGSEHLASMRTALVNLFDGLRTTTEEMKTKLGAVRTGTFGAPRQSWQAGKDAYDKEYEEAKGRAAAHETQLKELSRLEERLSETRKALLEMTQQQNELGGPIGDYEKLRTRWTEVHEERTKLLEVQCGSLTEASNDTIRATVRKGAGFAGVAQQLKGAVTGSNLRRERLDAVAERVMESDHPVEKWETILQELEDLAYHNPEEESELPETQVLSLLGWTEPERTRVAGKLSTAAWRELAVAPIGDRPEFQYKVREGDYIQFVDASAGQQATALLSTLLNQEGPPLLIDQPEDDLDNEVVLDVVERVWNSKRRRQLIFASHNANLVVNGDAELVVCFGYRNPGDHSMGEISDTGAIDVDKIRGEITQVMEGGEKAFKLRKEKYGF